MKTPPGLLRRQVLAVGLAVGLMSGASSFALAQDYDVLIRGGLVFDGTGAEGRIADVAIKGDRIVEVGEIAATASAATVVDATGKYVSPGFIDTHSHAAPGIETPELAPAISVLTQGITLAMINPDGGGPADLRPQVEAIEANRPGVNVLPMIGHNGVRRAVMGLENRKPTAAELTRMQALVREAMTFGALGMSSGPFYVPGKYSDTAEIVALAKVAAEFPNAFHTSHIRDESSYDIGVLASVAELIEVSRQTGIIGVVSHMKMLGPTVWGQSEDAVKMIEAARAEGLSIWADQYPYAASSTGLSAALVPGWAQEGGGEALAKRLQNPEQRALIREGMVENLARRAGANAVMISSHRADPSLEGMRLDEIARRNLQDPLDTAIDILIQGGAGIVSFNMNEKDVELLMKQPWMMTSSDGALVTFGEGAEHPRAYGAYPRKLRRYVIERDVISLAQAIHSSTGLPAEVFAIPDRGVIRPGAFADVLVFNPETVRDVATYPQPHAYSEGMEFVFVNGKAALADGEVTSERHGRVILRGQ
ncbi:MAG: amidohydrolase family protein [Phenylobacterium sp.]|uniref:N-acyl-D-amino-acid deacylase family protein n=1 Tax=Phenylobacterium sp. TaxID=1871053 RepID=UPI002716859A|nr:amidohydrolase family protein [Phenylobacterium sp.]MDO8900206.1 amidohydrolase family protein [Phenylobacterium sp.]